VTSLVTRADPLPYANLLSHLLTHEFIHKSSHLSMGSAAIHAPLLSMPNIPPSALLSHRQPSAQFGRNRGRSYGSWRPQQNLHRGSRKSGSRPDFRSFHSTSSNDNRHSSWQGNWQRNRGSNSHASYVKTSDTLLLSAPNFSNVAMDSNIVPIWHYIILQVLLTGFRTPVQINMSHLTLQP